MSSSALIKRRNPKIGEELQKVALTSFYKISGFLSHQIIHLATILPIWLYFISPFSYGLLSSFSLVGALIKQSVSLVSDT